MDSLSNMNVFVVEDNVFYSSLLKNELESFCNKVTVFTSGEACLENMSLKPDVILLDYNLEGGMSGIEVLKRVKEFDSKLPVVFISGNFKLDVVKDALRLGAEDFIDKSDSGIAVVEKRLKDIFHLKTIDLEKRINKMAKKMTYLIFALMILSIVSLLYFASNVSL